MATLSIISNLRDQSVNQFAQSWLFDKYRNSKKWFINIPYDKYPNGYHVTREKPFEIDNNTIINSKYEIVCYQMPYKKFDCNRAFIARDYDCSYYCYKMFGASFDNIDVKFFVNHFRNNNDRCEYLKNPDNICTCTPCYGFSIRSNRDNGGFTLYDLCYALYIIHKYANLDNVNRNIFIKRLTFYNVNETSIMHYK